MKADEVYAVLKNKIEGGDPQTPNVTGVKGEAELVFRTGKVSISRADIGLENVNNTSDEEKRVAESATADKVNHALKFSGDIEETYDGSEEKTIKLDKEVLGLEKVENKSPEEIRQGLTQEEVVNALTYKPEPQWEEKKETLTANNWQGDEAPYTYEIAIDELTENQDVYITNAMNLELNEIEAFSEACITSKGQQEGKVILQALNKPSINLPVIIKISGERL